MQVTFYFVKKRRNSTKFNGTGAKTYNCMLKESSSITNPTIIIKWDGSGAPLYNYARIEQYDRYYWVTNWTFENRCWIANLRVDVLTTYKADIGAAFKYVLRAASDQNNNVVDLKYPAVFPFEAQAFRAPELSWPTDFNSGSYIISVIGNNDGFSQGGSAYYVLTGHAIEQLVNACFFNNDQLWSQPLTGNDLSEQLADYGIRMVKSISNPSQFINSIFWVPVQVSGSSNASIKLGDFPTGVRARTIANPLYTKTFSIRLPGSSMQSDPAELFVEPFAHYRAYIPPFGCFDLDARMIRQYGGIDGKIIIDVTNGESVLEVYPAGLTVPVIVASGTVGMPITIAGNSVDYAGAEKVALNTSANIAKSIMSLDIAGAVTGAYSGIIDAAKAGAPSANNGGYGGGLAALSSFSGIVAYTMEQAETDPDEQGHPIMEVRLLAELSGYILCADGDIETLASDGEQAEIAAFLTGGFFYE